MSKFVAFSRKTGRSFEPPQESDDPNSTIANVLDVVRQIGVPIDFPPSKLKQGYGEQAIFVLDRLSDEALRAVNFTWGRPMPPQVPKSSLRKNKESLHYKSWLFILRG